MKTCPECATKVADEARRCPACGHRLAIAGGAKRAMIIGFIVAFILILYVFGAP